MDDDETELVAAAANGDSRAFRRLVERHYDACIRFGTRMLGNRLDAEDAVQETFTRVYRSLDSYRDDGRFRGWLFRILVNRCRSAANRRRRWWELRTGNGMERQAVAPAGPSAAALDAIERAIQRLPEAQREAFLLKHVEEWTYEEMADFTGANVSALKMRVSRAREELRRLLNDEGEE